MNFEELNNKIIIVKDKAKKSIIKKINSTNKLLNIKVITLNELKTKYYFSYTDEAIYNVSKKYNVIPEIAKIYIDNLYYIKDIDDEKVKFLCEIKSFLEEKKLLTSDLFFKKYLCGKEIVLYDLENIDKFYINIFDELKKDNHITYVNEEKQTTKKKLYKAKDKNEEVAFVASEIVKLIKSGVSINNIKLAGVTSDYHFVLNKTFKEFKIPLELPSTSSIKGTILVQKFKELFCGDMRYVFEELKKFVNGVNDEKIYKKIIDVINEYTWAQTYDSVKDMIFKRIDNIKINDNLFQDAVRVVEFNEDVLSDDDYVFLINFNQGITPSVCKDEDYLSDDVKKKLGISDSVDMNIKNIRETQKRIKSTKNLIVTYSEHDLNGELYISNAYDENLFDKSTILIDFTSSNAYNKLRLLSKKDEYTKYGTINDELVILDNHYKDYAYMSYDNNYVCIDKDKLCKYLGNTLTLSYTSMNTYYKCGFRYYLDNVLKLNLYEETYQTTIGNIFHKILSECFNDGYDFDDSWNKCVLESTYEFNNMEKFFLNKLKSELALVIDTIKNQMNYTELKSALYEEKIVVPINRELNIRFIGFVDKVLYKENDDETIAAIIDYKTGNPELNIDNSIYGIDMQLPVYIYLLKNTDKIKNVRIGGFYLQKILNNTTDMEKRLDSLKLQGYSNCDIDVLSLVDNSYMDSKIIKSMKTTSNGFSSYAKVLSDNDMNVLCSIVEDKIREASECIMNAKFDINPKEIDGKLEGCKFCNYKDICYMKNSNIVKLKKVKSDDFLRSGGEVDA